MGIKFRYVRDYFAKSKLYAILMWIFELIVVIGLGVLVAVFFCQNIEMTEGSMEPTISAGDVLLVNNMAYKFSTPNRDDVIVFRSNNTANASVYIKRVIGLPGEKIQIREGQILIDGVTYMEQKDLPSIAYAGLAEREITLASNEYFVLVDNRNNSADSRYSDIGNVKRGQIVGKAWFRLAPYAKMGFIR